MKTDNELIAEFMGWERRGEDFMLPNLYPLEYDSGQTQIGIDKMEFHLRWDWLMPVVYKIGNTFSVPYHLYKSTPSIFQPIDVVYKWVVAVIKWYNEQKK